MPAKGRKRKLDVVDTPPGSGGSSEGGKKQKKQLGVLAKDVVCFTGTGKEVKEKLGGLVALMGGMVSEQLNATVTLVVAGHSNTAKVHAAISQGIDAVGTGWVGECYEAQRRLPPEDHCLLPFDGITVILSGFPSDDTTPEVVAANGGGLSVDLTSPRSVLVVHKDVADPSQEMRKEVLSRVLVRSAYNHCMPVVWHTWVDDTLQDKCITEKQITSHSVLNNEPQVVMKIDEPLEARLKKVLEEPLGEYCKAPLRGLVVYLHKGDAEEECCLVASACLGRLGAASTPTITQRTTHIVVASPESRPLLHQQHIIQVATSGSAYIPPHLAFPPSNIITIRWIFDALLTHTRPPTSPYLYSLSQKPEPPPQQRPTTLLPMQPAPPFRPQIKKESMPPPPSPLQEPKKPKPQSSGINVEKAQKLFGKSDMFKGKVFAISPSYAKAGKLTASKIILSHGGEVVKPASERAINYYVVPHHTSSHLSGTREEVHVENAQIVTEDWLSLCLNFQSALRGLEQMKNEDSFRIQATSWGTLLPVRDMTFTEALIYVSKTATSMQTGSFLPDPLSHFLYNVPMRKAYMPGTTKGTAPSPFVQHGKLRTAKKEGTGVAVCFSGIPGYEKGLLTKAVELLGGKVTEGYDSHVTTHVVTSDAHYEAEGVKSDLIVKAKKAAAKGGDKIVLGVMKEWLEQSARVGYFVIETDWVLFPDGARYVDKEKEKEEREARRSVYSAASSQPTPVVKTVLRDPETPSPRGCLNFDIATRMEGPPKVRAVKVCFAVSASKQPISTPTPPVEVLASIAEELGGVVVKSCVEATHYVAATLITTENTCVAMASGIWIMSPTWVVESGTSGKWKDEEDYEWSHTRVMQIIKEKKLNEASKDSSRTRALAQAVKFWRERGGGAFKGWNVHLCAGDVFSTILNTGGANIVSRKLPKSWKDIEEGFVLLDRKVWDTLTQEAKSTIILINSINTAKHDLSHPVEHRPGIFLFIEFISNHLLRSTDHTIEKSLCGHDPTLASQPIPPIPW